MFVNGLKGRVALVTGGAAGLGLGIAERLLTEGADVVISDIDVASGRRAEASFPLTFLEHDVVDELQWLEIVATIERKFGRLEILVNNAGILGSIDAVTPEDTDLTEFRRVYGINVESVFLGCRTAIPFIARSGGGSIVNIGSIAALMATPYATAYGASKAAVGHLTKTIAQHCAERKLNIRCNLVHPGIVRTPLWETQARAAAAKRGIAFEVLLEETERRNPLGGLSTPADVAAAVAYLVSDHALRVTGAALLVDGGVVSCDSLRFSDVR